ncbi:MAG: S-layer homology domain-containing protein [Clostridia bacterium]|nr:S-layer homology domain-containing protein [Clostridia bacterium]
MSKKIFATLLALLMVMTMSFAVTAAGEPTMTAKVGSVYEDDSFTIDFTVSGVTQSQGAQITITYDPAVIAVAPIEGGSPTAAQTYCENTLQADLCAMVNMATATSGSLSLAIGAMSAVNIVDPTLFKVRFTALEQGDMDFAYTITGFRSEAGDVKDTMVKETEGAFAVLAMPNKPSITAASIGGTLRAEQKAEASYTWNNGNTGEGAITTDGDASVINWTVDGEAVTKLETDGRLELTLKDEWVGKKLAYTVRPTAARGTEEKPLNNTADADVVVAASDATIIKAASTYTLTADVVADFEDEIIATVPVNVAVTLDDTYPEAAITDTTEISWYILPAVAEGEEDYTVETAKAASLEGITPVTGASATFLVENRDQWVVVVVAPKATIAGEDFTAAEVKLAAKISGEPPVIDASGIDTEVKLTVGRTLKTDAVVIDAKMPEGAEGTQEAATTYAWYALDVNTAIDSITEETEKVGEADKLKLTSDMKDKKIVLLIDYTNELGIPAETAVVSYAGVVQKASGSATQGGTSLVTGGTTTPGTTEPGTDKPVDEKDPADPAGTANDKGASAFTDVDKEVYAWGYDYLDKLAKAGVVKGMTDTTYAPEAETTYAQFTALVVRVLGLTAEDAATEKVAADHWSYAEVAVADKLGILADVAFDAEKAITREDMAAIAHKALVAKEVKLAEGDAVEFSDASAISEYAAASIEALAKAGILNGMGDGTFAPKGTTTRMQTAKVIGMIFDLVG